MARGSVGLRGAIIALVLLVTGTPALAQDARLAAALPAPAAAQVTAQMDSAVAAGLPAEPLLQKALEGAVKGAPPALVVQAVRALRGRLAIARDRLGGDAAEADLVAGAAALYAGVEPETLTRLRRAAPDAPLAMPLVVLADLIGRGVPMGPAADAVVTMARAGVDDESFRGFRLMVEQDIRAGAVPLDAARIRMRGVVPSAVPPGAVPPLDGGVPEPVA